MGSAPSEASYDRGRLRQWLAGEARADGVARRDVLRLVAAAGLASAVPVGLAAPRAAAATAAPGIVKDLPADRFTIRGTNAETRFESLAGTGHTTPVSHFFVRNHTATPRIDADTWTLRVWGDGLTGDGLTGDGLTGGAREFTLADLKRLPAVSRTAFVECAGNGRSLFATQQGQEVSGTAWTLGAVGVARWRGARLSDVLRLAGLSHRAVDVLPRGLDDDYVTADGTNLGRVRRPLPLAKALDDVILAYEMNGAPLPPDHGHPVRLLAPSWVGIASIKWLGDIEVSSTPLYSPWNTDFYRLYGDGYPPQGSAPLTRQTLKSAFELPWNARLSTGTRHRLTGRAWSGAGAIARVDVSTDAGTTWHRAHLHDTPHRATWTRWSLPWRPTSPGPTTLLSRATDTTGRVQPRTTRHNTQGYLFDAVVRHEVTVV
ncbi:sulfite oxidase [Streptomyces kanamyceticus]|uniref:Sulfite oxidase n=2 Tax=Streptomyces kanamyceticus TaxID=1967 RepID=A0A5J6GSI5_STRKN|nr:sulfite oxidase [Streptomyces kanamyceticus]